MTVRQPGDPANSSPPAAPHIGIVTGLVEEAEALRAVRPDLHILCHGVGPRRARRAAEALADQGARLLVSAGIAGGLDPARGPGDVVISDRILDSTGRIYVSDPDEVRRLTIRYTNVQGGKAGILVDPAQNA